MEDSRFVQSLLGGVGGALCSGLQQDPGATLLEHNPIALQQPISTRESSNGFLISRFWI